VAMFIGVLCCAYGVFVLPKHCLLTLLVIVVCRPEVLLR
jgi:hypothetical protein